MSRGDVRENEIKTLGAKVKGNAIRLAVINVWNAHVRQRTSECCNMFPSFALCKFRTESITRLDRFLLFHGVSMTSKVKNECDARERERRNKSKCHNSI